MKSKKSVEKLKNQQEEGKGQGKGQGIGDEVLINPKTLSRNLSMISNKSP